MGPCTGVHTPKTLHAPVALIPFLRWTPSLLAENNQARCESHPVARRVGAPSRAAADESKSSGGGDRVYHFLHAADQKKSTYFTAPSRGPWPWLKREIAFEVLAVRDSCAGGKPQKHKKKFRATGVESGKSGFFIC